MSQQQEQECGTEPSLTAAEELSMTSLSQTPTRKRRMGFHVQNLNKPSPATNTALKCTPSVVDELTSETMTEEEIYIDKCSNESSSFQERLGEIVEQYDKDYDLMLCIQRGISKLYRMEQIFPDRSSNIPLEEYYMRERTLIDERLIPDDFVTDTTFHFRDTHCEFRAFCPIVFQIIRNKFGIDERNFQKQLGGEAGAFTRMGTPGKSGAFFFYCPSMQYLLKTVSDEEYAFFLEMLPNYTRHITNNPQTLLSNYYSFFEVALRTGHKFRFVVMNNVFNTKLTIHRKYDLKGSTAGRAASEVERRKKCPVLKDKDIDIGAIQLIRESKLEFYERLQKDCHFLRDNEIMDYSLLLGVHDVSPTCEDFQDVYNHVIRRSKKQWTGEFYNCVASRDENQIYFFGVIDILQKFNSRKLMEKVVKSGVEKVKSKIKSKERMEKVSVANPLKYARRFEQFIKILCSKVTPSTFKLGSSKSFQKLDEAEEYYNMVVRENTHETNALFYRAVLYHTKFGNTWNALQDLNKSIKVNPTYSNVRSYLWRGLLYTELGEYDSAIKDFSKLIEMNPYCADAFLMRGVVYHQYLKQFQVAEKDYAKSLEINHNLSDPYKFSKMMRKTGLKPYNAYIQKGILYCDMGEKEKALLDFKRAIDAGKQYAASAYVEIGRLFEKYNDEKEALIHYSLAIEHDSKCSEAYLCRGLLYKVPEKAIEDFTKAIEYSPQLVSAYLHRGLLFSDSVGDMEAAVRDFTQAIVLNPVNPKLYIARGNLYQQLDRAKDAERDYIKAIDLDRNLIEAYTQLTSIYLTSSLRDVDKAQYWIDAKLNLLMGMNEGE